MNLKAVFFDLDGTLLDTAYDLAKALNSLLTEAGKKTLPSESIREVVSNGANALLKLGFNITPESNEFEELRKKLLDYYLSDLHTHTRPFPCIENLIERLVDNQLQWGIVTNKPWAYTEPLMKAFAFKAPAVAIICPDHVEHKKPSPDALLLACRKANCHVSEAIYIGDHARDIECGKRAGMETIAVGYGYIPSGENFENWGATHNAHACADLWPIIKENYLI